MKRRALHTLDELAAVGLVPVATHELQAVADQFSVAIAPAMIGLIDKSDPRNPIAAQFVPAVAEGVIAPEEIADPIGSCLDSRRSQLFVG
ncbi:MAG: hypothetical protein P4M09_18065 [Devosia sp.]|nr:hypothetical protein [Devosia sp.]